MNRLLDKVALITGAAGAIGAAAARRFVKEGAEVFLVDRDENALERLTEALGPQSACFAADVSDAEQSRACVNSAVDRFGGIEGVVGPRIDASPIDAFDRVMAVNVRGAWLGIKYVAPELIRRGGGSIVISSSVAGLIGYPGGGGLHCEQACPRRNRPRRGPRVRV
jgi:NAD(P)-dependent dehydrogenase (short-subunit alcohol dehydrogenase family)